jgi:hypothetical protein
MSFLLLYIFLTLVFIITLTKPLIGFWISLALFFDPGGFFQGLYNSNLVGPINVSDMIFLIITLAFTLIKSGRKTKFDNDFRVFFKYFILVEIYFILVYGYLIPKLSDQNTFLLFVIKERHFIYGIFVLWYVYIVVQKGLYIHYKITVYSALIILSLFILGQVGDFNLIPTITFSRYQDENITRISLLSYGLFQVVFPFALIVLFLYKTSGLRIPDRNILIIGGILLIITYLLTLTRRTYINIAATIFFIIIVIHRLKRIQQLFTKLTLSGLILLIILSLSFPSYIKYSQDIYLDTFLLLSRGTDSRGKGDYRVSGTGDLEIVKDYIKENPLFGKGFSWMSWDEKIEREFSGDKFAIAWDAAQEVPIFWMIFSKGFVGLLIYSPVYIFLILSLIRLYKLLKKYRSQLIYNDPILFCFGVALLAGNLVDFTAGSYNLYGNVGYPYFMLQAGMLFGINRMIVLKYTTKNQNLLKMIQQ